MFAFGGKNCFHYLKIAFITIVIIVKFFSVYFPSVNYIAVLLHVETIMAKSYNLCLP